MTEVQKPLVIYEDNQGEIFLGNKRQVGMRTKHIDISHNFLRKMVEDADIMTKNTFQAYLLKHEKRTIEG